VEPENRLALLFTPTLVETTYKMKLRSGKPSIFEVVEDMPPVYWAYLTPVHFEDILFNTVSRTFEAGIFKHRLKTVFLDDFQMKSGEIGPQVLTLRHLGAGFVVICVALGLSVIVFAAECAPMFMRKLKRWFGFSVVLYVIVKFIKMNRML
jgi:hypothetical protein